MAEKYQPGPTEQFILDVLHSNGFLRQDNNGAKVSCWSMGIPDWQEVPVVCVLKLEKEKLILRGETEYDTLIEGEDGSLIELTEDDPRSWFNTFQVIKNAPKSMTFEQAHEWGAERFGVTWLGTHLRVRDELYKVGLDVTDKKLALAISRIVYQFLDKYATPKSQDN